MINPLIKNRYLQKVPVIDLMSTLQSVQINPTEMCNRSCSFCPRGDPLVYKNKKVFVSTEICTLVGKQLNEFNFKGRVGFVGFGEPLLNSNLTACIDKIKQNCPSIKWIEVNTNGDFLNREVVKSLYDSGCTDLTISMYDEDSSKKFISFCENIPINLTLRHYYNIKNINFIDRVSVIKGHVKNIKKQCYIPFYKLFIDWNGDYLLCDQDWGRKSNQYNIEQVTIKDFWTTKLNKYRKNLITGDRQKNSTCNSCDINGTLIGEESFEYLKNIISS